MNVDAAAPASEVRRSARRIIASRNTKPASNTPSRASEVAPKAKNK
jgi:hypothetical protein